MNRPLAVWGLLVFIGFIATHYLMYSYSYAYVPVLWIILAILGVAYCKCGCCCKILRKSARDAAQARAASRMKGKCRCCAVSDVWAVGVIEAAVLTAAIAIQLIPISPFYILSVWLLSLGAAFVAESLRGKSAVRMQLGAFWLFSGVFFPFVSNYQYSTFIIGALVLGLPLIVAGLAEKK